MILKKSKSKNLTKSKKASEEKDVKPRKKKGVNKDDLVKEILDEVLEDETQESEQDSEETQEVEEITEETQEDITEVTDVGLNPKMINISELVSSKIQEQMISEENSYYNIQCRVPRKYESYYKELSPALRKSLRDIFLESLIEMHDQYCAKKK